MMKRVFTRLALLKVSAPFLYSGTLLAAPTLTFYADARATSFEFQQAAAILSTANPQPPLVWQALDQIGTAGCVEDVNGDGTAIQRCDRPNPNVQKEYRFRAWKLGTDGVNRPATEWAPAPNVACIPTGGGGCPCLLWPSAAGCTP